MKKISVIGFLFISILVMQLVVAEGFKVSPAWIKVYKLARGQELNSNIAINNLNTYEETFFLNATGDISDWISFYLKGNQNASIDKITIGSGGVGEIVANFKIPEEAANGYYSSIIYVETAVSNESEANKTYVKIRYPINVLLEVIGEQYFDGDVKGISMADTEINKLIRIKIDFENTGNINANPRIEVSIAKDDSEIASFVHDETTVNVGETKTINAEWDTKGQTVGYYVANVKVYAEEKLITERNIGFNILERGSLSADGSIKDVNFPERVGAGQVVKIEVEFENTGEIDLTAKISGEVLNDKGELIDVIEGDEQLVRINETERLAAYFKTEKSGTITINSNVIYEGKKLEIEPINISVTGTAGGDLGSNDIILVAIIVLVGIIAFSIIKLRKF